MGHRLMLEVPGNVYQSLKQQAEQTGQSPEALALLLLATAAKRPSDDPLEQFIGIFSSRSADWADDHDAHLGKAAMDKMRRSAPEEGHSNG